MACRMDGMEGAMSRTQTAFASATAAPEHAGLHQEVVEVFAAAWSILWKAWLGVVAALLLAVGALVAVVEATGHGPFGGGAANGMAQAVAHPLALVVVAAAVLATWYAFVAVLYLNLQRRRALAADYVLRPVRRLAADDFVP